jgi:AraC-like DNA-binding protein/quercetin dioxygenase-like cupin family protein
MLGIRFHPYGAARVFAQPMHELSARFTPIEDLSLPLSRDLDRALQAHEPVAAVEAALLSAHETCRDGDILVAEAVRRITLAKGVSDLASLASDLGLSIRQLERRFHTAVGLPPKFFCRIQRFNNVFLELGQQSQNWVQTAIACGYYDQAHLIRDCKSLSGHYTRNSAGGGGRSSPSFLRSIRHVAFVQYSRLGFGINWSVDRRPPMKLRQLMLTLGVLAIAAGQSSSKAIFVNVGTANWTHEKGEPAGSEGVTLRSDPRTGGMDLLVRFPAGHVIAPHWHESEERIFVAEGQLTLHQDTGDSSINTGGFAFLPAREIQRISCSSQARCTFYLSWDGKPDSHPVK